MTVMKSCVTSNYSQTPPPHLWTASSFVLFLQMPFPETNPVCDNAEWHITRHAFVNSLVFLVFPTGSVRSISCPVWPLALGQQKTCL